MKFDPPAAAFLYAHPATHSLSPAMHNAAFAWAGIKAHYQARDIAPADLPAAVQALRTPEVLGANLSLPHKETVLPLLDSLSSAATAIGAVNTIINKGGELHGENTDARGLMLALEMAGASATQGEGVTVVLGAGGAARAAVWALGQDSQQTAAQPVGRETFIVNRTLSRAKQLAQQLGAVALAREDVPWERVTLLLNASSAGLNDPQATPLPDFDFGMLPQSALVYDMVYKPAQTRLLREAQQAGLRAENGLGMLAHQARLAFIAWTGQEVPLEVFLNALGEQR